VGWEEAGEGETARLLGVGEEEAARLLEAADALLAECSRPLSAKPRDSVGSNMYQ
jgi:hypothetical protein